MLTEQEYLITKLAEESVEIAQRCTKILTFGLRETQEGKTEDNHARLVGEICDFCTVLEMLEKRGIITPPETGVGEKMMDDKKDKVERYMEYSRKIGTLQPCQTSSEK